MTYRDNKKAKKLWSEQANTVQERKRLESEGVHAPHIEFDPYIKITVERKATEEKAVFECFEGTRIDNYRVYCNDEFQGVQSMSALTKNLRKALPRFRRMED